ncbi:hypothetical protein [Dactylosporangium darangshiense]|uniref:hypothetical protein n=1 Tax=Dactylosporangium darangshiense TaxID=579108 RepID=UPI00363E60CA
MPEVFVGDELGQFEPGVDLLVGGVFGQFGGQFAHPAGHDGGVRVGHAVERAVDEVVDDALALLCGQPGELVHHCHLLCGAVPAGHGTQDGAAQPQRADLRIEGLDVGRGKIGQRDLPGQQCVYGIEAEAQVT